MKRLLVLMTALVMAVLTMNAALGEQEGTASRTPVIKSPAASDFEDLILETPETSENDASDVGVVAEESPVKEVSYRTGMVLKADSDAGLTILDAPDGQCIATAGKGQMIWIATPENGWIQVCWNGMVGFVRSDCVALYNEEAAPEEKIRAIRIDTNLGGMKQVKEGTVVSLTATLTGFEDDVYTLQWEYSPDGGNTAIAIAGANKRTYAYRLTAENFGYMYRLVVHIEDAATTAEE